jgi:hypothetical protein
VASRQQGLRGHRCVECKRAVLLLYVADAFDARPKDSDDSVGTVCPEVPNWPTGVSLTRRPKIEGFSGVRIEAG